MESRPVSSSSGCPGLNVFEGVNRVFLGWGEEWLPVLDQVRTFTVAPDPDVRLQMDGLNQTILGAGLLGRVGTGLVRAW